MYSITIPRLELCAAVLLAVLIGDVTSELHRLGIQVGPINISLWTDSSIVLSCIYNSQLLKPYVANRVAQILDHTQKEQWKHVPTNYNPADLISRGVAVDDLINNKLWWQGPVWLTESSESWPTNSFTVAKELPEIRVLKLALAAIVDVSSSLLDKHSHWMPLVRITAWILRFISNIRSTKLQRLRLTGPLSVQELKTSQLHWIRHAQSAPFAFEFKDLVTGHQISKKSKLRTLSQFIGSDGLIHVGSRLGKSELSASMKHPLVLPSNNKVTKLIFKFEHERLLHAGPQTVLAQIHRQYWPLQGRGIARRTIHQRMTCFRFKPTLETPNMAQLPKERVIIQRAFYRSGVDLCYPIFIKSGIRRVVSKKSYVSVFVYYATRAIHLELVSDLTTQDFLAALTRFMSRRGLCSHIPKRPHQSVT